MYVVRIVWGVVWLWVLSRGSGLWVWCWIILGRDRQKIQKHGSPESWFFDVMDPSRKYLIFFRVGVNVGYIVRKYFFLVTPNPWIMFDISWKSGFGRNLGHNFRNSHVLCSRIPNIIFFLWLVLCTEDLVQMKKKKIVCAVCAQRAL